MFFLLPLTLNLDCKIDKRDYLTIMQGYTYKVEVNMFDNDSPLDLTNAVINIDFMKADKKFIIQTKDITISGNKVSFNTDSDFSNISGKAKIQIIVKKDGFIYGSWVVDVVIKPSAINDNDGQSENKLTITQDLKDTIAKAEADIVAIPIEAEKKINELTSQANTSIETLKTNTQKTITDLTNQANTSINNVSSNADTKINALITKSNQTIANLEQAIANGDIESIKHEVFDEEYGTFTSNKSMVSVGESTVSTYGISTLEEPMLEETTEDESGIMTLEEPMLYANTVTEKVKTGIPKKATLKGKTLVNLNPKQEYNLAFPTVDTDCYSDVVKGENNITFTLNRKPTSWFYISAGKPNLKMLKPNTKYLVYFGTSTAVHSVVIKNSDGTGVCSNTVALKDGKAIVTTNDLAEVGANSQLLWCAFKWDYGTFPYTVSMKDVMLFEYQEGMENWDIPYFEGMASVVNPSVTSVGKNLFDGELELGAINEADGKISINENCVRSKNYQRVIPNMSYALSNDKGYQGNVYCYTKDKTYISPIGLVDYKFTAPENCYYVKFRSSAGLVQNDLSVKFQLKQGTVSTEYEPYKSNTVTSTDKVILRRLPNGVCDTLNLITGEYVQRIGEVTLNESNIESAIPSIVGSYTRFTILDVGKPSKQNSGLCDKLQYEADYSKESSHVYVGGSGNVYIFLETAVASDLDSLKIWIKSNPLTIQYELATPIVKTVDLTGLPFIYEDGHILLSADSILPTLEYTVATTLKSQGENTAEELLDVKLNKLGKTEKASDSALLNGVAEDRNVSNNTIVKRGSNGEIYGKAFYLENNNSLASKNTSGSYVALAYMNNANSTVYGAITNPMLLRSQAQPKLNINGTEKEILSQHNLPIETGTFTPNIKTITSGVSFTLNEDTFGRYQRIGNKVFVNMRIAWTTKNNAPAGEGVVIGGLPYAPRYSYETLTIGLYHGLGLPSSALELVTHISSGNGGIVLYYTQSATNWLIYTPQHINNEGSIVISGFYTI